MPLLSRLVFRAALAALLLATGLGATWAAPTTQEAPPPAGEPTPSLPAGPGAEPSAAPPTTTPGAEPSPAPPAQPGLPPATAEPAAAPAQTVQLAISKALEGSDVVQVGQYLTFTIRITNTGTAVVTDLPLVDEFDPGVLQPAPDRTTPAPTDSSPGLLRWADLTADFGDLEPGRSVAVTAVFRAVRIVDEVINRARVETGLGSGGGGGGSFEDEAGGTVEGGRVIVEKALVESFIDLNAPVISFTLTLRNDGFTDIVRAPLADTYRADLLSFISASVPPDVHNPATGELRWNNLLAGLGVSRLAPQETVSFTTVYRVSGPIADAVVNSAGAVDVVDEFGNSVASPRRAEVRIRIGAPATATAIPEPTPEEQQGPRRSPTPTTTAPAPTTPAPAGATPTPVAATPSAISTAAPATPAPATPAGGAAPGSPTTLPNAGAARPAAALWLIALLAIWAGLALRSAR